MKAEDIRAIKISGEPIQVAAQGVYLLKEIAALMAERNDLLREANRNSAEINVMAKGAIDAIMEMVVKSMRGQA